ncbi:MAG: chromate transporter [Sphaerochaetaceae bacterium]|jgi:chromate transporter|nr:chromate transporter [Sphaerochaetaceae bacterium]MDX9809823.1 chromate transporter [Sphaerochaetaceae bacterium]
MKIKGKEISKARLFWILFKSTFTLSAFTIGGGYVIVPLMRKLFVDKYQWIDEQEMLDLIAIAQAAPGVMAVNTSLLIGYKIAGVAGALTTLLGTILPPLITLTIFSYIYGAIKDNIVIKTLFYGMSIGVAIVILDAVVSMGKTIIIKKKIMPIIIMIGAFILAYTVGINIVLVILASAAVGIITTLLSDRKKGANS